MDNQKPGKTSQSLSSYYCKELSCSRPLSSKDEAELARRIQEGDVDARNELVQANLRFVVSVALGYGNRGLSLEELVSAGNTGLLKAADRFDWRRGFKFISYGVWWVRQSILDALKEERTVRIPVNRLDLQARILRSFSGLQQELQDAPSTEQVADDLGVSFKEIDRTLRDIQPSLSLDAHYDEESGSNLLQTLSDPVQSSFDEALDQKKMREEIWAVLDTLEKRESEIIRLYFGLDRAKEMTLEEIGDRIGLTRERIRQIKEQALMKLRHRSRARRLVHYLETLK